MAPSLLVSQATDSGQKVHLHPLVLLTASDHITRHRVRQLEGPIVGLLLGQQNSTQISAEYAFTAKLKDGLLDQSEDWTTRRIEQFKEVHQKPVLEVVGWFTLCPESGPLPEHGPLHKQLVTLYAENAIMLGLHPEEFNTINGAKSKLPVSVYESISEGDAALSEGAMQVDGAENPQIRFRTLPFVIETDETEMIAINYVAKGAGSAAAVSQGTQATSKKSDETDEGAGKKAASEQKDSSQQRGPIFTPEEEDQIAGLTTRMNSIKMLHERLQLMTKMVQSVPPSYLTDQSIGLSPDSPTSEQLIQLRNIQALLSRLSLLTHASSTESNKLIQAGKAQSNDVYLTSVLSMLGQNVQGLSELGRKFMTVEQSKAQKSKNKGGFGPGAFGTIDDFNGRSGMNPDSLLMM